MPCFFRCLSSKNEVLQKKIKVYAISSSLPSLEAAIFPEVDVYFCHEHFSISFFSIHIYPPTFKYCAMFENLDKCYILWASQVINNSPANAGDARDLGSISRLGRSPGVGNGNPLQYSSPENPRNREVWRAAVYEVT